MNTVNRFQGVTAGDQTEEAPKNSTLKTMISQFNSTSTKQTEQFAARCAECLEPGLVIGLIGNLGAGKTLFVRALVSAFCGEEQVSSPTFVLMQEYYGDFTLYHFDVYRLKDEDEFLEMGGDEYLFGDGVCLIEWADKIIDLLPEDRVIIEIAHTGETSREFHITATGDTSEHFLGQFTSHDNLIQ